MSEPSAAPTPSFRGRGRGRGRSQAVRAHVARLAQARKAANGRRGRQKLYDHPKPQAASERLKELKAAFSTVANALRPALEDLADRNLDALKAHAHAYRAVPEFAGVKAFLDSRFEDEKHIINSRFMYNMGLANNMREFAGTITREGFIRDIEDAKDQFVEAQLQRLDILERLHDNELPIDIIDDSWNFREISDERFLDVKAYVEYRTDMPYHPVYGTKVEVPCSKIISGPRLSAGGGDSDSAVTTASKRKAEDEAYAVPAPKRLIGGAVPRHISGLLSGVVAPTDDDDADADEAEGEGANSPSGGRDSKLPSPTPQLADEEEDLLLDDDDNGTPAGDDGTTRVKPSERLPPLPNGASEPDAYDVRLVNKRCTANFDVYNRILVPALFDFEPHEIGFRDSTNDKSRGATKIKRGRFLGTPNSNTMHFDRSLWQYDATTYEDGDLDEDLVRKHNLHPKYGLVLRASVNDEEPPKKRASGKHPIVFYTPRGRTFISSRSIRIARLEDGARVSAQRPAMAAALAKFVADEGVPPEDVSAPADVLQAYRDAKLKLWLGPRRVVRDETEELAEEVTDDIEAGEGEVDAEHEDDTEIKDEKKEEEEEDDDDDDDEKPTVMQQLDAQDREKTPEQARDEHGDSLASLAAVKDVFGALLDAAQTVQAEAETAAATATATASSMSRAHPAEAYSNTSASPPPLPRRAASKPFDPVRDVFMDDAPPAVASSGPAPAPAPDPRVEDASTLLLMASLAVDREYVPTTYRRHQSQSLPPAPAPAPTPLPPHQQPPYPSYQQQQQQPPMRYPSSRGGSQEYAPADAGPSHHYPAPPVPVPVRSLSIDPPQPPYHHQQPPAPPPAPAQPPHHEATLLDPRLFGESTQQQQQQQQQQNRPPPEPISAYDVSREPVGSYDSNGYYHHPQHQHHHQQQPPPSYMRSGAPADPYGPPPQARGSQSYYMSPPPQQHLMRPYDNNSSNSNNNSQYGSQHVPPPPPPPPMMSHGPPSPRTYPSSREYQPPPSHTPYHHHHHHHANANANSSGPLPFHGGAHNGDYQQQQQQPHGPDAVSNGHGGHNGRASSIGANGSAKFRNNKLDPVPMAHSRSSSEWPAAAGMMDSSERDCAGGDPGADVQRAALSASPALSTSNNNNNNELRTVAYDYETIKDYAALEPPPSHGPASIRGWAHNSKGGGVGALPPATTPEWDGNTLATASTPTGSEDDKPRQQLLP